MLDEKNNVFWVVIFCQQYQATDDDAKDGDGDNGNIYISATEGEWKNVWYNPKMGFTNRMDEKSTPLSLYVWKVKNHIGRFEDMKYQALKKVPA